MTEQNKSENPKHAYIPVLIALIGIVPAVLTFIGARIERQTAIAELQSTMVVLSTQAQKPASPSAAAAPVGGQMITDFPLIVAPFAGGPNDNSTAKAKLSVIYEKEDGPNYILDYWLPDKEVSWTGLAMQFKQPANLSPFASVEVTIKFATEKMRCRLKMVDVNGVLAFVMLGEVPPIESNVTIAVRGDKQVVNVPLPKNFGKLNLTQITELSFVADSDLGTGNGSFVVSRVVLLK